MGKQNIDYKELCHSWLTTKAQNKLYDQRHCQKMLLNHWRIGVWRRQVHH